MPKPDGVSCRNCAAYAPKEYDHYEGSCKRLAPTPSSGDRAYARWPIVRYDEWCFQWLPAETTAPLENANQMPAFRGPRRVDLD